MADAKLAIGAKVRSSDGHDLGEVERFVVDDTQSHISDFVVDKGIFDRGRVVQLSYIDSITPDGVVLRLTRDQAKNLPAFTVEEYVQMPGRIEIPVEYGGLVDLEGSTTWMRFGQGAGFGPTGDSFFDPSPIGTEITKTAGPIGESDVTLDHGTDVVSSDGHKLGKVDEVLLDEENKIRGFVIQAGFLFHHDIEVPFDWIASMTDKEVRLNVTKDRAEGAKR